MCTCMFIYFFLSKKKFDKKIISSNCIISENVVKLIYAHEINIYLDYMYKFNNLRLHSYIHCIIKRVKLVKNNVQKMIK